MVSNKHYDEMVEFYDKEIERLITERNRWRELYCDALKSANKIEFYEAILAKQGILGESSGHTDKIFVFEGKVYKPIEFDMHRSPGRASALDVEFVEVL